MSTTDSILYYNNSMIKVQKNPHFPPSQSVTNELCHLSIKPVFVLRYTFRGFPEFFFINRLRAIVKP